MSLPSSFRTDDDLSALARTVLIDAGFAHDESGEAGGQINLFENEYFIVAVAATPTLSELIEAEPIVEGLVQTRLQGADVGPKVWDAYIVLLTQERPSEQGVGLRPLFGINYDTRGVRRMARAGVVPTVRGVRAALTPFVQPVRLEDAGITEDPLAAFAVALISHGVPDDVAKRSVEIFQQGGRLDDSL